MVHQTATGEIITAINTVAAQSKQSAAVKGAA
jgi:hypothetical protein